MQEGHRAGIIGPASAQNLPGNVDALMLGGMGQQGFAVDVADGEDRGRGLQVVVHRNVAAPVQGAARLFSFQPVGIGLAAHGHQGLGRGQLPAVLQRQHGRPSLVSREEAFDARQAGAPGLAQQFLEFLSDVRILGGGQLRSRLHHGDGAAHGAEKVGHFQADGPRAHDDQAFGTADIEQVRAVEHRVAI